MIRRFAEDLESWGCSAIILAFEIVMALVLLFAMLSVARCAPPPRVVQQDSEEAIEEEAKRELGYLVFFDQGVCSLQGNMSCATCHNPDPKFGFADGRKIAVGAVVTNGTPLGPLGQRNVPTLINCWSKRKEYTNADGRTIGLFNPCLQAVADPLVGGLPNAAEMVRRVNSREKYRQLAGIAYGTVGINERELRECMVAFLKTIRSDDCYLDRLASGRKVDLPEQLERGWVAFQKHGCMSCHQPDHDWRDNKFHDLGISQRSQSTDRGRSAVTGNQADDFKFLTPTLREVAKTGPYMHDGSFPTLLSVVQYKLRGGYYLLTDGQWVRARTLDAEIVAMKGNAQDAEDITALLEVCTQSERYPEIRNPYAESNP